MSASPDPCWRAALLALALLLPGACAAPGPDAHDPGGDRGEWLASLRAAPADQAQRLLRLEGLLTAARRQALVRQGAHLEARLGEGWWLISGAAAALDALPGAIDGVTVVRRRRAHDKLGPGLRAALIGGSGRASWSAAGPLTLHVLLSDGVLAADPARSRAAAAREGRRGDGRDPAAALLSQASEAERATRVGFSPLYQLEGVDPQRALALAALEAVRHVELAPGPALPLLDESREAIAVEALHAIDTTTTPPTYVLGGKGRAAGIWDPNGVEPDHADLKDNLVRYPDPKTPSSLYHGTAVGSCLGGSGARSAAGDLPFSPYQLRGPAPEAKLAMYLTSADKDTAGKPTAFIDQYLEARGTYDVDVLSFSFSHGIQAIYDSSAANLDFVIARASASLPAAVPIAISSGNEANKYGYGSVSALSAAKNVLTVGASDWADGAKVGFSSFGPTQDGRLKPEVLAPGCSGHGKTRIGIDRVRLIPTSGSVKEWTFDGGTEEGFTIVRHLDKLTVSGGVLEATTTGNDPGVYSPDNLALDPAVYTKVEITMRADHHHRAELFWKTDKGGFSGQRRQAFFINADDTLRTYTLDLGSHAQWKDQIEQLRIDPITTGIALAAPGNTYSTSCGTSMSAPIVAGAVVLLRQAWAQALPKAAPPSPALIKALLVATARDMVGQGPDKNPDLSGALTPYTPGPDHATGYGEIQVGPAVDLIQRAGQGLAGFVEGVVAETGRQVKLRFKLTQAPAAPLTVTLAWDDPPGEPGASAALQNDLDLTVRTPAGATLLPWLLDASKPSQAATRGADHVNNLEQVPLEPAAAGTYEVTVRGHELARVPQAFALTLSDVADVDQTAGIELDADGDGAFGAADCDDADPAVHPGATEVEGNGQDDDCDPKTPDRPADGGPAPAQDAGTEGGPDGAADQVVAGGGGCSCAAAGAATRAGGGGTRGLSGAWGLALIALLITGAARRRRGR